MLVLDEISIRIAGRLLLEEASARIPTGARVGLVGRNGIGKTTLFRAIVGETPLEHGAINMPARARVGRLAQEAPGGPEPLIDVVLAADTERLDLLAEAESATDPHRIAEIQTRLADIGAHAAPARAAAILAGLGFDAAGAATPLHGLLRRLAHARRARRGAVLRAGPAAARRADQLSRSRRHALAHRSPGALSAQRDRDQPRPRPARRRGRLDPASRGRQAHALSRRLYGVRAGARGEADARRQARQEARGRAQAPAGLRRPLQGQGLEGAPGAVARQAPRQAGPRSSR